MQGYYPAEFVIDSWRRLVYSAYLQGLSVEEIWNRMKILGKQLDEKEIEAIIDFHNTALL